MAVEVRGYWTCLEYRGLHHERTLLRQSAKPGKGAVSEDEKSTEAAVTLRWRSIQFSRQALRTFPVTESRQRCLRVTDRQGSRPEFT